MRVRAAQRNDILAQERWQEAMSHCGLGNRGGCLETRRGSYTLNQSTTRQTLLPGEPRGPENLLSEKVRPHVSQERSPVSSHKSPTWRAAKNEDWTVPWEPHADLNLPVFSLGCPTGAGGTFEMAGQAGPGLRRLPGGCLQSGNEDASEQT